MSRIVSDSASRGARPPPTSRRAPRGRGRSSARRGRARAGGGRARARCRAGAACRRSSVLTIRSAASAIPTSSSSSSTRVAQRAAAHPLHPSLEHQVLAAGAELVDARVLRHVADRAADGVRLARARRGRRPTRCPASGVRQRDEDAHGRRLAGAVRPEQPEDLALAHRERDAVERLHLAVALPELVDDDRVHRHRD